MDFVLRAGIGQTTENRDESYRTLGPIQGQSPTPAMGGQPFQIWAVAVSAAQISSGYRANQSIESPTTGATVAA